MIDMEELNKGALTPEEAAKIFNIKPQRDEWEIDLSKNYPEPRFIIKSQGSGILPRGDIQAIKAKSKSGKTFAASIMAAVVLGAKFGNLEAAESNASVVYFDTEQNALNSAKILRRVHTLLGWDTKVNNPRLKCFALRRMEMSKRQAYIKTKVEALRPTLVIIDGIADLIANFNDIDESSAVIEWLMKLSADNDCAILNILHENKSKEDSGMKGHLGTMLLQKASDVFQCSKANGAFTVAETDSRNLPIEDWSFAIDGHGIPFPAESMADRKQNEAREKINNVLKDVFKDIDTLTYSELVASYALHAALGTESAKKYVRTAKEMGLLSVEENRYRYASSVKV